MMTMMTIMMHPGWSHSPSLLLSLSHTIALSLSLVVLLGGRHVPPLLLCVHLQCTREISQLLGSSHSPFQGALSLPLPLSLSYTHSRALAHYASHWFCTRGALPFPLSLSLSLTHTLPLSLSLSVRNTHSLTLPDTGYECQLTSPRELARSITSNSRKPPQIAPRWFCAPTFI